MRSRNHLPASATWAQRLVYPVARDFFFFLFAYLAYAPIRRVNKPTLDGPVLWASSHSNFLCDAIPPSYEAPIPAKFLAKSTLFVFPLKRIIEFCGALPLARAQDVPGESAQRRRAQNLATFEAAIGALREGWPVAIYPEGTSIVNPGLLLPLKTGAARLAISAEEENGFRLGLRIIPVGLEYGNRTKVGSGLWIRYGQPLVVSEYRELHDRDPEAAVEKLTADLTREMVSVFPHFLDHGREVLGKKLVTIGIFRNKWEVAQLFLHEHSNDAFWEGLARRMRAFDEACKSRRVPLPAWGYRRVWKQLGPGKRPWRLLYLLMGFPLFLLDLPNSALPEFFLTTVTELFAADETERMSVRFLLSPSLALVLGAQFWVLGRWVFPELLGGWGWPAYVAYGFTSCWIWYFAVHWRRQYKRMASLFFFKRAGLTKKSEAVARYRDLRQYLGQFQHDCGEGRESGTGHIKG